MATVQVPPEICCASPSTPGYPSRSRPALYAWPTDRFRREQAHGSLHDERRLDVERLGCDLRPGGARTAIQRKYGSLLCRQGRNRDDGIPDRVSAERCARTEIGACVGFCAPDGLTEAFPLLGRRDADAMTSLDAPGSFLG